MIKMDREGYGPEFDDRLIKLVKGNSAIYDVRHPHYRRTPVRMAIWDNIAKQLGAPSRFLQTKWKNIRYNYLQEQKCLETGTINANIRKRRFTEDLSFLKNTAYRRDGVNLIKQTYNESDDSYNFLNLDKAISASNTFEVIELDHSEDEAEEFIPNDSSFLAPVNDVTQNSLADHYDKRVHSIEAYDTNKNNIKEQNLHTTSTSLNGSISPTNSHGSCRSSPLLTPLSMTTKNDNETKSFVNGKSELSDVTIQPMSSSSIFKSHLNTSTKDVSVSSNTTKSKVIPRSTQIINDPIELYCLSLADCLRAMSRSERERVKYEFSKILKDAHYKDQL